MGEINISEILKDCPTGTKLYSPLCGECEFDRLNQGTIICKKQNTQEITFTSEGYYMLPVFDDCECMLFPSKENRDWSTFQRPFKDGDILYCESIIDTRFITIYQKTSYNMIYSHADYSLCTGSFYFGKNNSVMSENKIKILRLATEEEKQKLFNAIKKNGYKWNAETRTLDKLNPNKFDISTLKPFDKVLYRMRDGDTWHGGFYIFYKNDNHFIVGSPIALQCIPYENNEHLLGATDDCDEYYKTW